MYRYIRQIKREKLQDLRASWQPTPAALVTYLLTNYLKLQNIKVT